MAATQKKGFVPGLISRKKDSGFNVKQAFEEALANQEKLTTWQQADFQDKLQSNEDVSRQTASFWSKLTACFQPPLKCNPGVQIDFRDWREQEKKGDKKKAIQDEEEKSAETQTEEEQKIKKGVKQNPLVTKFQMKPKTRNVVIDDAITFEFEDALDALDPQQQFLVVQVLDNEEDRNSKDRVIAESLLTFFGFDCTNSQENFVQIRIFDSLEGDDCGELVLSAKFIPHTIAEDNCSKLKITVRYILDLQDINAGLVKDDSTVKRDIYILISWLLYMVLSIIFYIYGEDFIFIDALYLRIVTAFTVGYGDFYPVTNAGKLLNCLFIIIDTVTIGFITSKVMGYILRFREIQREKKENQRREEHKRLKQQQEEAERKRKQRIKELKQKKAERERKQRQKEKGNEEEEEKEEKKEEFAGKGKDQEFEEEPAAGMREESPDAMDIMQEKAEEVAKKTQEQASQFWSKNKLWVLGSIILLFIIVGTFFMVYVEGQDAASAFEWNFVTLSTVGYGDVTPATTGGKVFTIFYIIFGVSLVIYFGTAIFEKLDENRQKKFKEQVMRRALISEAQLLEFDVDGNGKIDKYEFLSKMLVETNEVEQSKIDEIMRKFKMLDTDNSGEITTDELREIEQQ